MSADLRERIARALFQSGNRRLGTPDRDWDVCAEDYRKDADAVLAVVGNDIEQAFNEGRREGVQAGWNA